MSTRVIRPPSGARKVPLISLATAGVLALAACAGSTGDAADSNDQPGSASGTCGKLPTVAPKDPQGVLEQLPEEMHAAYNGYPTDVVKSPWADWEPSHPAPYKVAIVWQPNLNSFTNRQLQALQERLEASGDIDIVSTTAPQSPADIPGAVQLYNQAVAESPDLIITMPLASGPMIPVIEAAAKKDIPTVTPWVATPTPSAVTIGVNNWLQAALTGSEVVDHLGGSGNVLLVHGIPAVEADAHQTAGFNAVLEQCPDIKLAGEVTGNYVAAAAKGAALQFLSANPAKIDGVFQSGSMASGVIEAFQQLGRPVPAIADVGANQGSVAYAHERRDDYQMFGTLTPDAAIGEATADVVIRMLGGDGPNLNQLIVEPQRLHSEDVDSVYEEGWTLSDTDNVTRPDAQFLTEEQLDSFFGAK